MKKVLSVLLAGAMMLGMSVASFAANVVDYGNGTATPVDLSAELGAMYIEREGQIVDYTLSENNVDVQAGDVLYFELTNADKTAHYEAKEMPSNWKIRISNSAYVDGASFYAIPKNNAELASINVYRTAVNMPTLPSYTRFVKVQLANDFDADDTDVVRFAFYLYDTNKNVKGADAVVEIDVYSESTTYTTQYVNEDDLEWVLSVEKPTAFKYKKGEKSAVATMDFADGTVLADMKFYPGETYKVMLKEKYNKELSKEYDTDVETIELTGIENATVVFASAKDNKQLVEVVAGELVPVEAEYVKEYKFNSGAKAKGYLVEGLDAGVYALIDADVEIVVEEEVEAPVEETPAETEKANPETGAADFVGAAVAMAVVSVAAAGALALKK